MVNQVSKNKNTFVRFDICGFESKDPITTKHSKSHNRVYLSANLSKSYNLLQECLANTKIDDFVT